MCEENCSADCSSRIRFNLLQKDQYICITCELCVHELLLSHSNRIRKVKSQTFLRSQNTEYALKL